MITILSGSMKNKKRMDLLKIYSKMKYVIRLFKMAIVGRLLVIHYARNYGVEGREQTRNKLKKNKKMLTNCLRMSPEVQQSGPWLYY